MKEYLNSQIKTNETIVSDIFTDDELNRFSKSDYRWADNISKQFRHRTVKKGEIYQFEFGKNYRPEMSYEHRGLVIGVKQKLLYVLPIFSYDSKKHMDVYHSIENPTSKSDLFLLKNSEFSFISHDSVLKLNDIRTVSINRILYQQNGIISPESNTYRLIEQLVLKKYFPSFCHEYEQLQQKVSFIEEQRAKAIEEIDKLSKQLEEIKKVTANDNNDLKSEQA
jgi:hypothetical protein